MNKVKLEDIYQSAAVSMSECLRTAADVLEEHSALDLTPEQLADMIVDLMATLAIADMHASAMAQTQRLMKRGYLTVSVETVNAGKKMPQWEG